MGKVNITDKVVLSIDSKTFTITDYKLLKPANALKPGEIIIYDNQGDILTYLERTEVDPPQHKQEQAPVAEQKKEKPKEPEPQKSHCPRCGADLTKQIPFKSQRTGAELCKNCFGEELRLHEEHDKEVGELPENPWKNITIEWFDNKAGIYYSAKKQYRTIEEGIEFIKSVQK